MFLMSTSLTLSRGFVHLGLLVREEHFLRGSTIPRHSIVFKRRRRLRLVPNARWSGGSDRKTWWQKLFFDEDAESWFGSDSEASEEEKFEAWKKRAEVITELREAQEDARNSDGQVWEDWLLESPPGTGTSSRYHEWDDAVKQEEADIAGDSGKADPGEHFVGAVKDFLFRSYDDDLLFEDKVFRYASVNSAKFLALLVLVPWAVDFAVHDYVLMPFLDRRNQKLEMIKALKVEKARYRFEVEIGKAPPLSEEEVWLELQHKARELRDEWRLENRKSFANIWSDMTYGITLFLLMYFNQSKVALLRFTGYKLINNISDTGKAFLIILITDIFLGAITVFVCFVPVVIDACVKLWLFKILPRLSPNVANIFREMKRH
ncbi:unnamed protein product [Spirodela intermedia]|uniref:Uncharacterized protein n=1 Tax=Spirodela intermedia TaxID=51605 RepID=A0A7I8IXH9_SPIIN|nr:unnamed protein product [Spirodela intermedia]CAA6662385.1 unnamed protein product [Spirodela intermedia]